MGKLATGMDETRKPQSGVPTPKMRRGLKSFFNEVKREMTHVSWPTKSETNRLTTVVLAVCGLVVVVLTVMSYCFETVVNLITKGSV